MHTHGFKHVYTRAKITTRATRRLLIIVKASPRETEGVRRRASTRYTRAPGNYYGLLSLPLLPRLHDERCTPARENYARRRIYKTTLYPCAQHGSIAILRRRRIFPARASFASRFASVGTAAPCASRYCRPLCSAWVLFEIARRCEHTLCVACQ